jgi:hypothetical protein
MTLETKYEKDEVLVATETGSGVLDDGTEVRFVKGRTRIRAGGEVHKKFPLFFDRADKQYDIEEATARPGKKRGEK